ncbi:hypothetical protein [Shimia sagamensis]|uniref:Uncharacterized protein n=1 Tax=Shimia sagamensis TaxID=1566352 RepID=A0ABY1P9I3_9RHOB|nr:hypothetical protein [Shimia sagamensis]SMP29503.1 hypothetical protein SAMN06265373_106228 [Shimia sagamensis]
MIETAPNARTQQAYSDAHAARSAAFVGLFKALFGGKSVPLNQGVLTEPSRCA